MSQYGKPVVVGVDGTPENTPALRWAAAEALSRGVGLRLVRVCAPSPLYGPALDGFGAPTGLPVPPPSPEVILDTAMAVVRQGAGPHPELTTAVIDGYPGGALVDVSEQASVVVVGSRHRGPVGSFFLGSTGAAVAARAACPAVVVRGAATETTQDRIVVGVDLSPLSSVVLGFAFDHASRHGVRLRAVLCWNLASALLYDRAGSGTDDGWPGGRQMLADELSGWREKYPDVVVERVILPSYPSVGLVAEARDSRLLVVGAQNRHPRVATLMGSVSQGVLHHATCPVAVVHPSD